MNRRSFLGLTLGAPLVAQEILFNGGVTFLRPKSCSLSFMQQLQRYSLLAGRERTLVIPKDHYRALWEHLKAHDWLYGNVDWAQAGYDHLLFNGRPLTYWLHRDWICDFAAQDIKRRFNKGIFAIDAGDLCG